MIAEATTLARVEEAATGFEPIADALRAAVLAECEREGSPLTGPSGLRSLETNSSLAPRRANTLLAMLAAREPGFDLAGRRVLDLGCGFGSLAVYLAYLGAKVIAVDAQAGRLTVGREVSAAFGLNARFIESTAQALPLADRSVELVVINNSFCYVVPRPDRLLSLLHVRRVLEPGGRLLMRNPSRTTPRDPFTGLPMINRLSPAMARRTASALGRHRSHVRLLGARGQRIELERVGFEVIEIDAARRRTFRQLDRWVASYQHVHARRPVDDGG